MNHVKQFTLFAGVGAIGTFAHYALLILLVSGLGAHAVLASAVGFLLGAAINYLLNYVVTFGSKKMHYETAPKFAAVAAVGMALNGVVMSLCVWIGLHYLVAQVVATAVVLAWGFIGNRSWTFKDVSQSGR